MSIHQMHLFQFPKASQLPLSSQEMQAEQVQPHYGRSLPLRVSSWKKNLLRYTSDLNKLKEINSYD